MIMECLVSYLCLDWEWEVGHSDSILVKCEHIMLCNLPPLYTNSQVEILRHMVNVTRINRCQETHYISLCTKFEGFILIYEAMNAKKLIWATYVC